MPFSIEPRSGCRGAAQSFDDPKKNKKNKDTIYGKAEAKSPILYPRDENPRHGTSFNPSNLQNSAMSEAKSALRWILTKPQAASLLGLVQSAPVLLLGFLLNISIFFLFSGLSCLIFAVCLPLSGPHLHRQTGRGVADIHGWRLCLFFLNAILLRSTDPWSVQF